MISFIKLTNNFQGLKGNPLYINVDHVTAVFSEVGEDGMERTFIYGGPSGQTWDIEESVGEVIARISIAQSK